jgi:hypothetical protein
MSGQFDQHILADIIPLVRHSGNALVRIAEIEKAPREKPAAPFAVF